jgi:hypothetical protein
MTIQGREQSPQAWCHVRATPMRADEQDRLIRQLPGREPYERQGGAVGPVQVIYLGNNYASVFKPLI